MSDDTPPSASPEDLRDLDIRLAWRLVLWRGYATEEEMLAEHRRTRAESGRSVFDGHQDETGQSYEGLVPRFHEDIGAAWSVVERLTTAATLGFRLEQRSTGCRAVFEITGDGDRDGEWPAEETDAPLAVVRAALDLLEARF